MSKNKKLNKIFVFVISALFVLSFLLPFGSVLFNNPTKLYAETISSSEENVNKISNISNKMHPLSQTDSFSNNALGRQSLKTTDDGTLPVNYCIYNFDAYGGKNKPSPNVGHQKHTDLCWAFASTTAFESSLYTQGLVNKDEKLNFSETDLAYNIADSYNFGTLSGGAFELAYQYFSSEKGPVKEESWEKNLERQNNSSLYSAYKNKLINENYVPENAGFSAMESRTFPSKQLIIKYPEFVYEGEQENPNFATESNEEKTARRLSQLRHSIKSHIKNYGGVTSSIHYNSLFFTNNVSDRDNSNVYYFDQIIDVENGLNANHLITLVGWDDNKEYVKNGVVHKGVYIAQNSYGTDWIQGIGGYFFVGYDDLFVENDVHGFLRIERKNNDVFSYNKMEGSPYENNFFTFSGGSSFYSEFTTATGSSMFFANFFEVKEKTFNHRFTKIKVPTMCVSKYKFDEKDIKKENIIYLSNNEGCRFRLWVINDLTKNDDFVNPDKSLIKHFKNKVPIRNIHSKKPNDYIFSSKQTGFYGVDVEEGVLLSGECFAVVMEIIEGPSYYKNNNSNGFIPSGTYKSFYPEQQWQKHINKDGSEECVFPMIVETFNTGSLIDETLVENIAVSYDGKYHSPNLLLKYPDITKVYYTDENGIKTTTVPKIKDVKRDSWQNVVPYIFQIELSASGFDPVFIRNYKITINPVDLIIMPPNGQSKVYGQPDEIVTLLPTFKGNLERVKYVGRLMREKNLTEDVGQYEILMGNLKLKEDLSCGFKPENYNVLLQEKVFFSITPKTLYVTPKNLTKVYNDVDPEFNDVTFSGVLEGQTPKHNFSITREKGELVGENYKFSFLQNTLIDNGKFLAKNYKPVLKGHFSLFPYKLYLTVNTNYRKIYGEPDPDMTDFTFDNPLPNQTPKYEGKLSRESGEDVRADYVINKGSLKLLNNGDFIAVNYEIVVNEAYFEITHGTIQNVVIDTNLSKIYDGKYIYPTYSFRNNAVESDYVIKYLADETFNENNLSLNKTGIKDCGEKKVWICFMKDNYNPLKKQVTLKIEKRDLTISPIFNQQKIYGENDKTIQFNYEGVVLGEIPNFTGALEREVGNNVGKYKYLFSNDKIALADDVESLFLAKNYNLLFNDGGEKFEIKPKKIIISPVENQFKVYKSVEPTIEFNYTATAYNETPYFEGNLSRLGDEFVGNKEIINNTLRLVDGNGFKASNYIYLFDNNGITFEIKPFSLSLSVNNIECFYGNTHKNFTFSFDNVEEELVVATDDLKLSYFCLDSDGNTINNLSKRDVDGYEISAICNNRNYNATITSGRYFIKYQIYKVCFDVLGTITEVNIEHFSKVGKLPNSVNTQIDGYLFKGWKTLQGREIQNIEEEIIEEATTFRADISLIEYKIIYNLNGGQFDGSIENAPKTFYTIDVSYVLVKPSKKGYIFKGWFESSDFTTSEVTEITEGTMGDKTYYAKYEKIIYKVDTPSISEPSLSLFTISSTNENGEVGYGESYEFIISLNEKSNKSYKTMKVLYGNKLDDESHYSELKPKETMEDGSYKYLLNNIDENIKIVVKDIKINEYVFNFIADGKVIETRTVKHGEVVGAFPLENKIPTKEHFDQVSPKWNTEQIDVALNDTNIEAVYTPNVYNVKFVMEDGKEFDTKVTYGEEVDSSILQETYNLNMFKHFEYDKALNNVLGDTVINVKIIDNTYILYIVLVSIVAISILGIIIGAIRRRQRHKFNWWAFKSDDSKK